MKRIPILNSYYILPAALILFMGMAMLSLLSMQHTLSRKEDVVAGRVPLEAFDQLMVSLLEAESAQRGYLLTLNPAFLDAYGNAEHEVVLRANELQRITIEDVELVRTLERLTKEKIDGLRRNMDIRQRSGEEAAAKAVSDRAGKDSMDRIRQTLTILQDRESARLEAKRKAADASANKSFWFSIFLMIFACILAGVSTVLGVRAIRKHRQAERESALAQEKTAVWARELENTSRETRFINEFSDSLGVCFSDQESHGVIASYLQQLFPGAHGSLAILNNSRNLLETVLAWNPPSEEVSIFDPNDCHGLRCGSLYHRAAGSLKLVCQHVVGGNDKNYLCMPLSAQGDTLGVLHIDLGRQKWDDSQLKLVVTLASQYAMKLANLKLRDKLKLLSIRDPLTGLYNRRYMEEVIERELLRADRSKTEVGLIMGDLDHFKQFNDTYGHEAGDRILHEVASVLSNSFRREDIVCRYGGEELLVIVPDIDGKDLMERANLVCDRIRQIRLQHHGEVIGSITMSLGVALYPRDAENQKDLINRADSALYDAKRAGRDRVLAYSPANVSK